MGLVATSVVLALRRLRQEVYHGQPELHSEILFQTTKSKCVYRRRWWVHVGSKSMDPQLLFRGGGDTETKRRSCPCPRVPQ